MEFLQVLGIEKLIFQEETRKKNKESVDEVYGVDRNTSAYLLISETTLSPIGMLVSPYVNKLLIYSVTSRNRL